jgi:S1-C subfamily serine protease
MTIITYDHPEYLEAATVCIVANYGETSTSGSGFIAGDGYIVTNAHVVDHPGKNVEIFVLNKYFYARKAKIVAMLHETNYETNDRWDLALLSFDPPKSSNLPILSFNFNLKTEDRVRVLGYPGEMLQVWWNTSRRRRYKSPPVISADGTIIAISQGVSGSFLISHSAHTSKGYSGGPIVNDKDEVVGIHTWGNIEGEPQEGHMQAAIDIALFLIGNGVTPKLTHGQHMPTRPE